MKKIKFVVVIICLGMLMGCNKGAEEAAVTGTPVVSPNEPVLMSESTQPAETATDAPSPEATVKPVGDEVIEPVEGVPYAGLWAGIDGSTATIPLTEAVVNYLCGDRAEDVLKTFNHNTTPTAYDLLLAGEKELIFVTYPSEQELELSEMYNVQIDLIPVVKDAFVFLVNEKNPVKSLTIEQLQGIYTGEITNWSEVGGNDAEIIAYQRPERSGSQTLFLELLMKDLEPMEPPSEWVASGMGDLVDAVSSYDGGENSIGYSVYYYAADMYGNENSRLLAVDGVAPDAETIAAGDYPLETYYYAVLRTDTPEDAPARQLVKWMRSDEGQKVAVSAGYVPLRKLEG